VYATAPPWAGLSWVAVWMLDFTVMIPIPPRWALLAALGGGLGRASGAGVAMATAPAPVAIMPLRFFLLIIVPYWLIVRDDQHLDGSRSLAVSSRTLALIRQAKRSGSDDSHAA
jgi:hypothetical protein